MHPGALSGRTIPMDPSALPRRTIYASQRAPRATHEALWSPNSTIATQNSTADRLVTLPVHENECKLSKTDLKDHVSAVFATEDCPACWVRSTGSVVH